MKQYSIELFESSISTSASGCNISVDKSPGPNIPRQLAAKV